MSGKTAKDLILNAGWDSIRYAIREKVMVPIFGEAAQGELLGPGTVDSFGIRMGDKYSTILDVENGRVIINFTEKLDSDNSEKLKAACDIHVDGLGLSLCNLREVTGESGGLRGRCYAYELRPRAPK